MRCNEAGLNIIRKFEGLRLEPYRCPAGIWTIGYGHTKGVTKSSQPLTEEIAERLLIQDAEAIEKDMKWLITKELNANQWSACVSWFFNIGATKIRGSRTPSMLNRGDFMGFADALLTWNKSGGQELDGLTKRRQRVRALFLTPLLVK
jgi:lysozyme